MQKRPALSDDGDACYREVVPEERPVNDATRPSSTVLPRAALPDAGQRHVTHLLQLHQETELQGGVILVTGPRGVGKGVVLQSLRKALSPVGRVVLFGRAENTSEPYAVLREPCAQMLAFLETRGLAEAFLDAHARALSVVLPHLLAHANATTRARDKATFLEALRALFIEFGKTTPFTLILGDTHAADDDARDAVRFLGQHLFGAGATDAKDADGFTGVLVASIRSDDKIGLALVNALTASAGPRVVEVGGMGKDELIAYLSTHPQVDRLLRASKGRSEDVDELLESLPDDIDALLRQRVANLPALEQTVLLALSILARPASPDMLAHIVANLPKNAWLNGPREASSGFAPGGLREVVAALTALVEQRLLARQLQNGELLFRFVRVHHTEALLSTLPYEAKEAMHLAVADAMASRSADGIEQILAFHYLRGSAPVRGVVWAERACEQLLVSFAYSTVIDLVTRALPHASPQQQFALLGHATEAHRLRGDTGAALSCAERLQGLAPADKLPSVLRRMGELYFLRGEMRAAVDALGEALLGAEEQTQDSESLSEKAQVHAALADVAYAQNDLVNAESHAAAAVAISPRAPLAFKLRVSNLLGKIAYARESYEDALMRFMSNLRHAEDAGLDHEAVLARINAGLSRHRMGDDDEAQRLLERALTGARAVSDLHNEAFALSNLAAIFARAGKSRQVLDATRAALARFSRLSNRAEVRRTTWNLANLYVGFSDLEHARLYLQQSKHLAESNDSDRARALVASTEGDIAVVETDLAAARLHYDQARALFVKAGELGARLQENSTKRAMVALLLGDLPAAHAAIDSLEGRTLDALIAAKVLAVRGGLVLLEQADPQGLVWLQDAVAQLDQLNAFDDGIRTAAFAAERAYALGDLATAERMKRRARELIERQCLHMPKDVLRHSEADPLRAAILGLSPAAANIAVSDVTPEKRPRARLADWDTRYPDLVGQAPSLLRVFERLDRVTKTKSGTVLVRGESGTGKELVAAAVHRQSERAHGPFVRVNCAALVETLLMSELFGHEKGSFTGAVTKKIGRFELARGGTIFLDEIGDISPKTQVSLLRVLQERQFERVGGTQTLTTDAAVICATHRDLESMVKQGTFREDLYYRLRGVVIELPALRERREDILLLAERFLTRARDEVGRPPITLSAAAAQVLLAYGWPGNIRELQNVVRSVALFCEADEVDVEHLREFPELFSHGVLPDVPHSMAALPIDAEHARERVSGLSSGVWRVPESVGRTAPPTPRPATSSDVWRQIEAERGDGVALGDLKRRIEFEAIKNAITQSQGNITKAAAALKMKRPRLSQIVNGNPELKAIKSAFRTDDD